MPELLESCKKLFKTKDLYKVLSLPKNASPSEVKRGYHKLSLKVHPDRVHGDGKKTATEKFQVLGKIYCILSDKDKRAVYDEKGEALIKELSDLKDLYCEYEGDMGMIMDGADEEADEADEEAKKLGLGEEDEALKSLIHSNQQSRAKQMDSFFADLEAKYAEPEKKTKK
ncbi:DNAJC9 [Mytilus edulis]|uniref:DNAJC9 n=1 Tax=Mytilus edulis TaxID=6550 RepID=A0A8S3RJ04_MYTED|nr:DNAJC9 [Mytilus edulis]